MAKQSTSERIRKLLEQGYPVKIISKKLKCSPALVYQVRAYDKKKEKKWVMVETATSKEPIGIPKDVYEDHFGSIRVRNAVQPFDYQQPKQSLLARIKNFFLGA